MLNQKLHPAFGYVIARNTVEPSAEYQTSINSESSTRLFYVHGYLEFWKNDELFYTAIEGKVEESAAHPFGIYKTKVSPEGCEFFCLDPKINRGLIPATRFDFLKPGEKFELIAGTKFYLCKGELKIGDQTITGPKQVFVRSEVKIVEAITKCFSIIFL